MFQKDGSVTAGNAPGLNDGASALVVSSLAFAKANGIDPMATITNYATGGGEPKDLFFAPIMAVENLMAKDGTTIDDYQLIEANEAFAVQALADGDGLGWDWDRVNVNGGAVALGHPIGASGARVLTTLLYAMEDRGPTPAWRPSASVEETLWPFQSSGPNQEHFDMSVSQSQTTPADQATIRTGRRIVAVALGAAVVAVAAQVAVPMPFSMVPMTLSPLAVLLVGGILGPRSGTAAVAAYVGMGALGLPVFALGTAGAAILLGPTGGYLLAFPVAAGVTGLLARRGGIGWALLAAAAGLVVIHVGGWAQLTLVTGDPATAFRLGTVPFLVGDVLKVGLAAVGIAGLAPSLRRLL